MTVLLDSYCWFEYFFGSRTGARVRKTIDSAEEILVSSINVFEVYRRYLRMRPSEAVEKKRFLLARAKIIPVDSEIACFAAGISAKHDLHAMDSIIYATAAKNECRLLTGDKDFRKLPGVELV